MSKAKEITNMIEGFKLGSLGARKPVDIGGRHRIVWDFKEATVFDTYELTWTEGLNKMTSKYFKLPKGYEPEDVWIAIALHSTSNKETGKVQVGLALTAQVERKNKKGGIFGLKYFRRPDVEASLGSDTINDWIKDQKTDIQQRGLEAVEGFPKDWEKYEKGVLG